LILGLPPIKQTMKGTKAPYLVWATPGLEDD
jgi:hypothetical protein